MERNRERDNRVARQLLGYVVSDLQREIVQIEHRYSQLSDRSQWDAMVCIGNREFRWSEVKFFHILSDVLNELPDGSYLVIPHNVLVSHDGILQIAMLEERLYPYYEDRTPGGESGGTVVYQLKLSLDDAYVETAASTQFGYAVTDLGGAMEQLRRQLPERTRLRICYFCKYFIEYNDFGGTDDRHDQLYCFRDAPDVLKQLMAVYPVLREHEYLLLQGIRDMDAFHSCPLFSYRNSVPHCANEA
ncbi:MAG: hypothetical protein WAV74_06045 [Anaerolineae bacterium]